jgi:hypothetical protein
LRRAIDAGRTRYPQTIREPQTIRHPAVPVSETILSSGSGVRFTQGEARSTIFTQGEARSTIFTQGEARPTIFMQGEARATGPRAIPRCSTRYTAQ